MSVLARDLIEKQTEHIFKDTNTKDIKQSRVCLVVIANINRQSYYLILSSHSNNAFEYYQRFPDWNYLLAKKRCDGLKYTSCVNLRDIYEGEPLGRPILTVPENEFRKLIIAFKRWQNSNPDKLYNTIKDLV